MIKQLAGPVTPAGPLWYIRSMQRAILIAVVAIAIGVIAWAMWPRDPAPVPESAPVDSAPPPPARETVRPAEVPPPAQARPESPPVEPVPELQQSDPYVRERLEPMELPESWLGQGEYVRRLMVLAENATRGDYPRRQLGFLAPKGAFKVTENGDRTFVDPAGYDRYDSYVDELEEVDPQQLAGLLGTIEPLMETSLLEIGVDAPPGDVLAGAMREVMAVPVLDDDVELVQPNVMYQFADPELESLPPLQKQILRMGPENVRRLQAYVERLAEAMDIEL